MDISFSVLPNIDDYKNENGVFFKDRIDRYTACGMFYAPAGNEVFKKAIDKIVSNCHFKALKPFSRDIFPIFRQRKNNIIRSITII
jgi:hypothetical protein